MITKLNVDLEKIQEDTKTFERVKFLRRLLLVHSYLYYVLDDPIATDYAWQSWADELVAINEDVGYYDEAFKDWDGTTGHHLPLDDRWVISKALQIRRIHEKYKYE